MTDGHAVREPAEQPTAPYLEAITAYGFRGSLRFHVPGHKGGEGADPGLRTALGDHALLLDVPQDIEGIDVGPPPTPYERAERLAADAYGAQRAWFLTNGATQGNHALCLALAPPGDRGPPAQLTRQPDRRPGAERREGPFVAPEYDHELGMAHGVTPEALAAAFERAPGAQSAFIVSPTYYGMAADVEGCAEVAHAAGAALIVDCAWGSHFGFHARLPRSPLAARRRRDARLDPQDRRQPHPIGHAARRRTERVDIEAVARAVRLIRSTSPSALLMASLDAARRQLAVHGEALLDRTIHAAERAREAIDAVPGCAVLDESFVGRPGIAGWDPLRIVIDVRGTGRTGYEVAAALRNSYDIYVELATHATLVLVLGIGQPVEALERLAHDFAETVRQIQRPGTRHAITRPPAAFQHETVVSPREAFLGRGEVVPVGDAVGRISCEAIAGYPPGVPSLLPGERITDEVVTYLRELTSEGARLHGASDPAFRTVRVLIE